MLARIRQGQGAGTLLVLLGMVVSLGIVVVTTSALWQFAQKRENEQELLFIGGQFRRALHQYLHQSPGRVKHYPMSLEALLRDTRYPGVKRHLRKIYVDPITGKAEWGVVRGANGEIMGVHSLSEEAPLKKSGFRLVDAKFAGSGKYSEWVFMDEQKQFAVPFWQTP